MESLLKSSSRRNESDPLGGGGENPNGGILNSAMKTLFGLPKKHHVKFSALDESAKKAAPKLFFAGERTFLQWMHTGILLAGISMALGSRTETGSLMDWVSVLLLPISIGIIIYAMMQCKWFDYSGSTTAFDVQLKLSFLRRNFLFLSFQTNLYDCIKITRTI